MAGGFGPADGVQDTILSNLLNEVDRARASLQGEGSEYCEECGVEIPEARRRAMPNARYCIACQTRHDQGAVSHYNRRGSKDSQLR
ncbi:DksA/TraR family C4-type zinc finger protein [Frateuria aurantia]